MKSLIFCCLFGSFLATAMCMECEACIGMGKDCNSWTKTCAAHEDTCVTFQTEVIAAPVSVTVISKACGVSDTCHLDYMETTLHDKIKVRIKRSCCTGEDCPLPPFPGLGFQVNQPNGLHCPACIGLFSNECTEHLVSCRASENQCLTVTGKEFEGSVGVGTREEQWRCSKGNLDLNWSMCLLQRTPSSVCIL
uniref:Phospholipase A2 inhibitor n=1 Tax=Naja naja TaxID=35670 RepID=A0A8C6VGI3_NAJNA